MDIYTLTDTFLANEVVDEFVSAIWTERWNKAGDAQLVLAPTEKNLEVLKEGTYLGLRGSKEVMEVETLQIEDSLLRVKGVSLTEAVLKQRWLWAHNPLDSGVDHRVVDYTDTTRKPGEFISNVVQKWAIAPTGFPAEWRQANLDWANEAIPHLTLGEIDTSGTVQRITAPIGPLHGVVEQLADQYNVGISLYLESADPVAGYSLKFKTYQGKDRTSGQTTYDLVRLVPELDGISDIKEIRSNALYKNVVYVYYKGIVYKHLAEPDLPEPEGLARRVLITDAVGEPVGRKWGTPFWDSNTGTYTQNTIVDGDKLGAFIEQNAKDALANHNYIRTIDGQTSPISDYKYGAHYELGDIIELEGLTGTISKARITEYIRSQDRNGERSYPTISVVT